MPNWGTDFLPSPMVARNAWGSKSRFFLATRLGPIALRPDCGVGSTEAWRAIFLLPGEPLGKRVGDIIPSFCANNDKYILRFPWAKCESKNHSPPCVCWYGSKSSKAHGLKEIVSDGRRYEPFCTVLLEKVSESIGVSKGQLARQTRRPDLPSRNRLTQTRTRFASRSGRLHKVAIIKPLALG